jgi:regulator of protease activity HflC (stomatin/prohibitin superfamily)
MNLLQFYRVASRGAFSPTGRRKQLFPEPPPNTRPPPENHAVVSGPALTWLIPVADRLKKVNMQIITMPVPAQDGITRDNVTVRVDAVIYFKVSDPCRAAVERAGLHVSNRAGGTNFAPIDHRQEQPRRLVVQS